MSLDSIVNVIITTTAVNLTQAAFGNMGLLACHSFWTDRVRQFGSNILAELVSAAVPLTHPIYLMAAAARAQNPAVSEFYVLKRTRIPTQVIDLVPLDLSQGAAYRITIDGHAVTWNVAGTGVTTLAQACTAFAAQIDAVPGVTGDGTDGEMIRVTGDGAHVFAITAISRNLGFTDSTPDPGIAQDLAECNDANGAWYGMQIDSQSDAEILAAAAWAEVNGKLFVVATASSDCKMPLVLTEDGDPGG